MCVVSASIRFAVSLMCMGGTVVSCSFMCTICLYNVSAWGSGCMHVYVQCYVRIGGNFIVLCVSLIDGGGSAVSEIPYL